MRRPSQLQIASAVCLAAAACAKNQASPATSPEGLTEVKAGIQMELVAAYMDDDHMWVTLCYQQPSGTNWIPGRHADDVSVSVAGASYAMSSLEFIGFRASPEGSSTDRCDRFDFVVPEQPTGTIYHLTVAHLVGEQGRAEDCPELQRRLDADGTRIKIECLRGSDGFS